MLPAWLPRRCRSLSGRGRAHRSVLWLAGVGLVVVCYAAGCQRPSPAGQAAAPAAKAEQQGDQQGKPKPPPPKKPGTVAEATKAAQSSDPSESMQAVTTLGQFLGDEDKTLATEAGKILVDLAKTNRNPGLRTAAIASLSTRADEFSTTLIALADDPDASVRDAAIGALARCSRGTPAQAKLEALVKSPVPAIQSAAVRALTALREGAGANEIVALVGQLGDPEGDSSAQAAIALKIKGAPALPFLEKAIRTSKDARQRHAATMCVALICAGTNPYQQRFGATVKATKKTATKPSPSNLKGLPILEYALNDPDAMTREVAAQGLGYLGDPRAAVLLGKALSDPDTHVRRRAASALITTPSKSVQAQLTQTALHDADQTVRGFAVEALGWIGDASMAHALVQAAKDPSAEVRRRAAMQLGRTRDPATLQALVSLFKDPDEDVRWASVQAVAGMRDRAATQYLVAALDDPVPQVSNAAEAGLQKLGIPKQKLPGAD